ncbi:MAG: DUF4416 family protein [Syntrophobacterales bacterium]|nr:MAG: DUF4416 family protein [Syntrophobacterales bacterium]
MGKPQVPKPAKLVMSLISSEDELLMMAIEDLKSFLGEVDLLSDLLPFNLTRYYDEEMGSPLFRRFIAFKKLVPREALVDIKMRTNGIEERYSLNGCRRVNIDPGILSAENVVLATTKDYAHRPYLRDGIFADLTLIFRSRSFRPLEWTYPDYRQGEVIELMNGLRRNYLSQLKRKRV